ncbi:histone H3-K79 methyltransferase [Mollisia scopiformis]|uniref:Histone-lysine N-methyltransferase, H3 lysine-79 specific n=1 Tax=Mollisia scopiformis TaxID=149040 RepID=A0A194XQ77_MOLSC|nr:histone H3-K79 methyltransferase [Mollisia scopiformis]KUJ22209.1 histone H3-K79 methyltransferase [Mollisia scopiformis]
MNLFGGKSNIKRVQAVVRTVRVADPKGPEPRPSAVRQHSQTTQTHRATASPAGESPSTPRSSPGTPSVDTADSSRLRAPKRRARRTSPAKQDRVNFGSDGDEDEEDTDDNHARKKQKLAGSIDSKRQLRQKQAFSEEDGGVFDMIHAANISFVGKRNKNSEPVTEHVTVKLQYPSSSQQESYNLVFGRDLIDPCKEILAIAKIVTEVYLTPDQAIAFDEPNSGILRQLVKARNILKKEPTNPDLLENFKSAVDTYNKSITNLIKEGAITKNLDNRHHLPLNMIRCMLRQVYDRAVSPRVDLLKQYENGTDNVYGELLPNFISEALSKTGLKSDQVFVDLGSGVGNVVLQAALEFGCESWGCEMMKNATDLADAQASEFNARCRLWGIQPGEVHLERGDFLESQAIHEAMKKADVILVNNQAFTPDLNQKLVQLFLDLKDGCKIVSLKSFVPDGYKITSRNLGNPVNLLSVQKGEYYSESVSWTDAGGTYFIATKDEKRLKKWADQH